MKKNWPHILSLTIMFTASQAFADPIKVATWNINSDRRAEVGSNIDTIFEGRFRLSARLPEIMRTIQSEQPEILFLQEIDPSGTEMVEAALRAEGIDSKGGRRPPP